MTIESGKNGQGDNASRSIELLIEQVYGYDGTLAKINARQEATTARLLADHPTLQRLLQAHEGINSVLSLIKDCQNKNEA